jgi:type IV pilus assembly protein PilE
MIWRASRSDCPRPWGCQGFTVIELATAIAIVIILAVVALASYQDYTTRKVRREATFALRDAADWLRLNRARTGRYDQDYKGQPIAALPPELRQSPRDGDPRYRISLSYAAIAAADPSNAEFPATGPDTFTLKAEPVEDDDCGNLLLDQNSRKGVTGKGATVAECWRR